MSDAATPEIDDLPPHRYTAALAQDIEKRWQDRWEAEGTFETPNPVGDLEAGWAAVADRPKLFVMDMFPYPSVRACTSATPSATSAPTSTPGSSG